MADSAETIKLYYDFKSPFTYLAMEPAYKLEETHRVRLRFIPLELAIREAYGGGLYADRHGRFRPYADRVFERFFKRELNIEDFDALAAVMAEVGLDPAGFR